MNAVWDRTCHKTAVSNTTTKTAPIKQSSVIQRIHTADNNGNASTSLIYHGRQSLCGHPNRPHYGSCPSARLSVCLPVPYGILTQKRKSAKKPKFSGRMSKICIKWVTSRVNTDCFNHSFYARQLYRQVLLRARISYGNFVRPSVRLSVVSRPGTESSPGEIKTPGFHHVVA